MSLQDDTISTYGLLDPSREAEPQAKPPTACRALESPLEQSSVHKAEPINSHVLCHLFDQPTYTSAVFICDRCGAAKERYVKGMEDIMHTLAAEMGSTLRHNVIETHGLCSICVEVEACRHPEQCHHDHPTQIKKKLRQKDIHPCIRRAGKINYQRQPWRFPQLSTSSSVRSF